MLEDYMSNFENILAEVLFMAFTIVLAILCAVLIISLLLLIFGCIIKSQILKSKFLKSVPIIFIGIIFLLCIPVIFNYFKELM